MEGDRGERSEAGDGFVEFRRYGRVVRQCDTEFAESIRIDDSEDGAQVEDLVLTVQVDLEGAERLRL